MFRLFDLALGLFPWILSSDKSTAYKKWECEKCPKRNWSILFKPPVGTCPETNSGHKWVRMN